MSDIYKELYELSKNWRDARKHLLQVYADGSNSSLEDRQQGFVELGKAEWALYDYLNNILEEK